jgi:hypothetical protein
MNGKAILSIIKKAPAPKFHQTKRLDNLDKQNIQDFLGFCAQQGTLPAQTGKKEPHGRDKSEAQHNG